MRLLCTFGCHAYMPTQYLIQTVIDLFITQSKGPKTHLRVASKCPNELKLYFNFSLNQNNNAQIDIHYVKY